jgi:hypothetical protein
VSRNGCGSPFVTSTDGTNNTIVWVVGSQIDQRLQGYDGDTGAVVYAGGGANELMAGTHSYTTTGIAARGRIYVATDNKVYAFIVPGGTPTPTPIPGSFARVILATEPANLKGYWKCNQTSGTTLVDSSGHSKNLTLHGVAGTAYSLAQPGEQGASIRFYGTTNSYADRSDSPNSILGSSNLQNSNWTMFALVKGNTQAAGAASVMGLGNSGTVAPFVAMDSGPSLTKIRAQIRNNDFSYTVNFEGGSVFNSIWHSVVFRRNGTNFHIFVDGVIAGTFSGTPTITNAIVATSLGKLIKSGHQRPSLNGYIQHAAIWNTALSVSEIVAIQAARNINPAPTPTPSPTPTPTAMATATATPTP